MISFNVPPYTGREKEYVSQAIDNHKICGDGPFTKKCSAWLEERTGQTKSCSPLPVRMQQKWLHC